MEIDFLTSGKDASVLRSRVIDSSKETAHDSTTCGPHPRLLLDVDALQTLLQRINVDPDLARIHRQFLEQAENVLMLPLLERALTGKRLLDVARDAMHHIPTLALAYRTTGDVRFREGGVRLMLAVAAFADFNPSHFLDVAEMTAALAIGYDWLYAGLSAADRGAICQAIVDKGLRASFTEPPQWWTQCDTNWNQVCHGGLLLGALAVADEQPTLAAKVVERAVGDFPYAMRAYAPDGGYPEGPMYWAYGTTYNLLAIAALKSALGHDFGLSQSPGFKHSADYHLHLVGPTGRCFSYSDCEETSSDLPCAAAYYLAQLRGDRSVLFYEHQALGRLPTGPAHTSGGHGDAWLLLVWAGDLGSVPSPVARHYVAGGQTPVATFRSGWDAMATFVGIKGGSPAANHAHMDVGSFCLDARGVRWASDLGKQEYDSIESTGISLWDMSQTSDRWQVYRIGPTPHNILTVDGQDQVVSGQAAIIKAGEAFAVIDTSPVYAGQLATATRGVQLRPDRSVRLQDEIAAPATATKPTVVRWTMLTHADVEIQGNTALLTRDGQRLTLAVRSPSSAVIRVVAADPPHEYDTPNRGAKLVTIDLALPPGMASTLAVDFVPSGLADRHQFQPIIPLGDW